MPHPSTGRPARAAALAAALLATTTAGLIPRQSSGVDAADLPVVSLGDTRVAEGATRGDWIAAIVPVVLSEPTSVPVTVDYEVIDGTAKVGQPDRDYSAFAGSVTIAAGKHAGGIWTSVLGDGPWADDADVERFRVRITNVTGATVGDGTGDVEVVDYPGPGLVVADIDVPEPVDPSLAAPVWITFRLEQAATAAVTFDWETVALAPWPPGVAYEGSDYLARAGTATIEAGRTSTRDLVWVRGDQLAELDERFAVDVGNVQGASVADGRGIVTIVDGERAVSADVEPGDVFEASDQNLAGRASHPDGVGAVTARVRHASTLEWLQPDGSFGPAPVDLSAELTDPGAADTGWTIDATLPAGPFWLEVSGLDTQGTALAVPSTVIPFQVAADSTLPSDRGYVTLHFGRSQWGIGTVDDSCDPDCAIEPGSVTLDRVAHYLRHGLDEPLAGAAGVAIGEMSADPERQARPFRGSVVASWDDLAMLRDEYGWTFQGDSYGPGRPKLPTLAPTEQEQQSCGSLDVLRSRGHDRAWGLYSLPGNQADDVAHTSILTECYSYTRRYGDLLPRNTAWMLENGSNFGVPLYAETLSVNGGACNAVGEACATDHLQFAHWNPNNRTYMLPSELAGALDAGTGAWHIVQFYRFVTGANDPTQGGAVVDGGDTGGTYWDCSDPDPARHWTSRGEVYCWVDFQAAIESIDLSRIEVVDPARVAVTYGRGNPNR